MSDNNSTNNEPIDIAIDAEEALAGVLLRERCDELPCKLTPEELASAYHQLAQLVLDMEQESEEEAIRRRARNEMLKEQRNERRRLAKLVSTGQEKREVNCKVYAVLASNARVVVRMDTEQVVNTAALTAEEHNQAAQLDLPEVL